MADCSATVMLGIKLDDHKLPKEITHVETPRQRQVCSKDPGHEAGGGEFCGSCGSPNSTKKWTTWGENEDFSPYAYFEYETEIDVMESGGEGTGPTILGKELATTRNIFEAGLDHAKLITTTEADYALVRDELKKVGIDTEPQLWLVTDCG